MLLYADDTVILSSNENPVQAVENLQMDLTSMNTWCAQNKLTINQRKKIMTFGTKNKLKPIFHWKWGSRWVPNANEIYTKKMKCTRPKPAFCIGTQRNLYSTDWRRGVAPGKTQILALGNAKIYQHVGISNAKCWRRGHCPTQTPDARYFASHWNIGFKRLQELDIYLENSLLNVVDSFPHIYEIKINVIKLPNCYEIIHDDKKMYEMKLKVLKLPY